MNRLQKKCIIASTGIHLLLAGILIVGPAFLSSRGKTDNSPPVLTFVAIKTSDDEASGGGDNTVKAPPAAVLTTPDVAVAPLPVVTPPAQVTPPVVERIPPPQVQKTPTPTPEGFSADPPKIPVTPEAIDPPKSTKHTIVPSTEIVKGAPKESDKAKADKLAAEKAASQSCCCREAADRNRARSCDGGNSWRCVGQHRGSIERSRRRWRAVREHQIGNLQQVFRCLGRSGWSTRLNCLCVNYAGTRWLGGLHSNYRPVR